MVALQDEPFVRVRPDPLRKVIVDVDPKKSIAAFYQRLQFTGVLGSGNGALDTWEPRIKILDLDKCIRS